MQQIYSFITKDSYVLRNNCNIFTFRKNIKKEPMQTSGKIVITVEDTMKAPNGKVWKYRTEPEHIMQWNHASDDWHRPRNQGG